MTDTSQCRGVLPDYTPARTPLARINGFTKKPMPLERVYQFSPAAFHSVGARSEDVAALEGLYAARHVLTTAADAMDVKEKNWLSVGGWASGDTKSRLAMPNLYSQAKLWREAGVKHRIMMSVDSAFAKYRASHGDKLPSNWEPLFGLLPNFAFTLAQKSDCTEIDGVPERSRHAEWIDAHGDMNLQDVDDDKPSEGDDGNESLSDLSSSSNGASATEPRDKTLDRIVWQLSKGIKGKLHLIVDGDLACHRRPLYRPENGDGALEALSTGRDWSPRCKALLPEAVASWWDESAYTSA